MEATTRTRRFGEGCLLAVFVCALTAVPTALRTSRAGGGIADGLLVGAAVLLPLVIPALALARAAGRGFRGVTGRPLPRDVLLGIALWIGLAVPALAAFGAVLKATTHHRGLGGTTFAVVGLGIVAVAALVAHRLVVVGRKLSDRGVPAWVVAAVGAAIAVAPLLVVAAPLSSHEGGDAASAVRASIIDGAIAAVATALVASLDVRGSLGKVAGAAGIPIAAVVLAAGAYRIESSRPLSRAMRAGGGLPATLVGALERWSDHDEDGSGAHFGGRDCDEGDPSRHPEAAELPGDGIDQDCDGVDPPAAQAAAERAGGAGAASGRPAASVVPAATSARRPEGAGGMLAAVAALPQGGAASAAARPKTGGQPDLVLVTLDTVRADHTTPYGYRHDTTPHLAELAKQGVVFEHAYAAGVDTQRALVPIVSARRYSETPRDRREWPTILPEADTLAERLKRAGYVTAAVTSFTWLSEERGFAQGFDLFDTVFDDAHPERGVTGELAATAAVTAWKRLEAKGSPIFLWVHFFDAHERYLEHPGGKTFGRGRVGLYDGEVAFVDQQLGALAAAVKATARENGTAWIVHGSHGEGFAEHEFLGHGAELYEEAIRVPLVVVLPGAAPGRHGKGAVSTLDVPATVLDLAGALVPPGSGAGGDGSEGSRPSGISLLPLVKGTADRRPEAVYLRSARRAVVVDWPLKLMAIERKRRDRLLLFDLAADPGETRDLSADRPEDLTRLVELRAKFDPGAR